MRRYGWVLIATSLWTIFVWGTRARILVGQRTTASFRAVHLALALVSIGFGLAVGWIGVRLLRARP